MRNLVFAVSAIVLASALDSSVAADGTTGEHDLFGAKSAMGFQPISEPVLGISAPPFLAELRAGPNSPNAERGTAVYWVNTKKSLLGSPDYQAREKRIRQQAAQRKAARGPFMIAAPQFTADLVVTPEPEHDLAFASRTVQTPRRRPSEAAPDDALRAVLGDLSDAMTALHSETAVGIAKDFEKFEVSGALSSEGEGYASKSTKRFGDEAPSGFEALTQQLKAPVKEGRDVPLWDWRGYDWTAAQKAAR